MDYRTRFASAVLAGLLIPSAAIAGTPDPALAGEYRVEGECHLRLEDGTYAHCVAWNTLTLEPRPDGALAYSLETATFATTAGGCGTSGVLAVETVGQDTILRGADASDPGCKLTFRATSTVIELIEPEPGASGCKAVCGYNASLDTDPFPRESRRDLGEDIR